MKRLKAILMACAMAMLFAGCGSGGGEREFDAEAQTPTPTPTAPGVPATIELTKSSPSISSDGRQAVRLFATVKDAGNVALPDVAVAFSATGTGASLSIVKGTTDATGQAEASLTIDDPTNRTITVTATAGGQSASTDVLVVGTTVAISGPASIVVGQPAVFQVAVMDASGEPVVGASVTAESAAGSSVTLAQPVSGTQGTVDMIVTAPLSASGTETLTVHSAGATAQRSVQLSTTSVSFQAPADLAEIPVTAASTEVRVLVSQSGAPVAGQTVSFTTTRGTLGAATAVTNGAGIATTTIASPLAGGSLITATSADGTVATRQILFVGSVAAKIEVQASPSTVGVNLTASATESSQIIAVVRDRVDNPVKGKRVDFSAVDPSAGAGLSPSYAITDETGRATVTFYPGPVATGTNAIAITATVDCTQAGSCEPPSATTNFSDVTYLTAARRALQVRIGTGNEVVKVDSDPAPVFNEMPYGVLVSDSADNPVEGVTINATLLSLEYGKGQWVRIPCSAGSPCWEQANPTGTSNVDWCPSEDVNENLRLDPGEDTNLDGILTPGSPSVAYFGETGSATVGTSDAAGSAVMRIRYLRDRNAWVKVRVRVSASLPDGTEGAEEAEFILPVLASDLSNEAVPPPGQPSPYGTGVCP